MRALVAALLVVLVYSAVALDNPIRSRVVAPGESIELTTTIQADGSKLVALVYSRGLDAIIRQESAYATDGTPLRLIQDIQVGGESTRRVVAQFQDTNVSIRVTAEGTTRVHSVEYPEGSIQVLSEWWFLRDQPIEGEVIRFWRLDLGSLEWVRSTVVYQGEREGLHRVVLDENVFYFDATGRLQQAQMAGRRFE